MRTVTSADFKPFDWNAATPSYRGRLPHLSQPEVIYFVTFRLADSLPAEVIRRWKDERASWLQLHPDPWPPEVEREYHQKFTLRLERWLDAGHGSCILRHPEMRAEVEASLLHDHGKHYDLGVWVIMPNHVHVLLQSLSPMPVPQLLSAAKGFSARRINEKLGEQGSLWMSESFDHIVRGMESLKKFQRYIANNPTRAGLPAEAFSYDQRWCLA